MNPPDCTAAFKTNIKLKHVCTHACVCLCMHTLVSHLQNRVCEPKEGECEQAGKDWRCREIRTLFAFLSTLEISMRLLLLTLSFHSIRKHILYTISILQYYVAVLVLDEKKSFVSWFMMPLDVGCLYVQAKHFHCAFFIPVSVFLISFPTDSLS